MSIIYEMLTILYKYMSYLILLILELHSFGHVRIIIRMTTLYFCDFLKHCLHWEECRDVITAQCGMCVKFK